MCYQFGVKVAEALAVLELKEDASWTEVRASYRRLLRLHHPDVRAGAEEAAQRTARIISAYALLARLTEEGRKPLRQLQQPNSRTAHPSQEARTAPRNPSTPEAEPASPNGEAAASTSLGRKPADAPERVFRRLSEAAPEFGEVLSSNAAKGTLDVGLTEIGKGSVLRAEVGRNSKGETVIGFTLHSPEGVAAPPIRPVVQRLLARIRGGGGGGGE